VEDAEVARSEEAVALLTSRFGWTATSGAGRLEVHGYRLLSGKAKQLVLARMSRQNEPTPASLKPRS
jgi:hypothetical protein